MILAWLRWHWWRGVSNALYETHRLAERASDSDFMRCRYLAAYDAWLVARKARRP